MDPEVAKALRKKVGDLDASTFNTWNAESPPWLETFLRACEELNIVTDKEMGEALLAICGFREEAMIDGYAKKPEIKMKTLWNRVLFTIGEDWGCRRMIRIRLTKMIRIVDFLYNFIRGNTGDVTDEDLRKLCCKYRECVDDLHNLGEVSRKDMIRLFLYPYEPRERIIVAVAISRLVPQFTRNDDIISRTAARAAVQFEAAVPCLRAFHQFSRPIDAIEIRKRGPDVPYNTPELRKVERLLAIHSRLGDRVGEVPGLADELFMALDDAITTSSMSKFAAYKCFINCMAPDIRMQFLYWGINREGLSQHAVWEPFVNHLTLDDTDLDAKWSFLQKAHDILAKTSFYNGDTHEYLDRLGKLKAKMKANDVDIDKEFDKGWLFMANIEWRVDSFGDTPLPGNESAENPYWNPNQVRVFFHLLATTNAVKAGQSDNVAMTLVLLRRLPPPIRELVGAQLRRDRLVRVFKDNAEFASGTDHLKLITTLLLAFVDNDEPQRLMDRIKTKYSIDTSFPAAAVRALQERAFNMEKLTWNKMITAAASGDGPGTAAGIDSE